MIQYKRYCCYINEKRAGMHMPANLYDTIATLFRERNGLAEKMLDELNKGRLDPISKAGADFCVDYRHVSEGSSEYINRFLKKLQREFNKDKENIALQKILDNKAQSINSSCTKCPYATRKSSVSQQTDSKLEAQIA